MLKLHIIASGSKGNAAIVEDGVTGSCVAIDCGIGARDYLTGCAELGVDPARITAMFITHEHTDHTKGLGVVLRALRKRGITFPVYVLPPCRAASAEVHVLEDNFTFLPMETGRLLRAGGMDILPVRTSHDAAASCGFRIEGAGDALGYLTDSGVVTPEAHEALSGVGILALEANHDPEMLRVGPYPYWLKQRVGGPVGHLSNLQAAQELDLLRWPGLRQVVAMHISENNNTYTLPKQALIQAVGQDEGAPRVQVAFQHRQVEVC